MNTTTLQRPSPLLTSHREARGVPHDQTFHEEQAILVLDEQGDIQHISRTARQILDVESGAIEGRSFFDQVHPDHQHRVHWDFLQMSRLGERRSTWLLRLKTGLGPWQWVKLEAVNCLGDDEKSGIVLWMYERGGRRVQRVRNVWPVS